ncbi:MAG: hypothetical protein M3Y54_09720 [Bacteroidota bacterium]|nr:hypothetical protein [Bacteroidota bacterium]
MKNNFTSLLKMTALLAGILSLGSCSRSEYAMLPKGPTYAGTSRVATPVHATPTPATVVTPAPAVAVASVAAPAVAVSVAQVAAATAAQPAAIATAKASHLNLVQRLAVSQLVRKVDKLAQRSGTARQHNNTAATQKLEGRLRQGIILAAIGLLVEILGAVVGSGLIYLLGAILIIVGGVFIVLYLIDKL